jgi:hypothetical protein
VDLAYLNANPNVWVSVITDATRSVEVWTALPPPEPTGDGNDEPDAAYDLLRAIMACGRRNNAKMYWRTLPPKHARRRA